MDLRQRDLAVVLDTMHEAAEAADETGLAVAVLTGVDRLVPSEVRTFNVIDMRSGTAGVVSRPRGALRGPLLERFAELMGEHPLIGHFARRPHDARALAMSDFVTRRQLHATALHGDFFAELDIEDQLAINLPVGDGTVIGLAVNRGRVGFDPRERLLLSLLRPHVTTALRALRARREAAAVLAAVERQLDAAGEAAVLLSRGRVLHVSARAEALLGGVLPEPVARALAARLDPLPVIEHAGRRLELTLLRGEVDVLRIRERPVPAEGHGLTARELLVLEHVRDGLSDREIAERLRISPRTVHHHLQRAYAKLGVRSRTAAVARLFRDRG